MKTEKTKIRVGIYGYGNLGRGVEKALLAAEDMENVAVFTRRAPESVITFGTPVYAAGKAENFKDKIDVMIICGGSATDLPEMTPRLAKDFCVVDSFDNHSRIPAHFNAVDASAREGGHAALISAGWDPGLFSMMRVLSGAILPDGSDGTFWGRGISQGHSDAIRRIPGVEDARQYTIPIPAALEAARQGKAGNLTPRQKHRRECFVVAREGADTQAIYETIVNMPAYFADYDTTVHFISREELRKNHSAMPHGGRVIRRGETSPGTAQRVEFSLELDSNPEFTGSVLVAGARALARRAARGETGALTMADLAPSELSSLTREEILAHLM